MINEFHNRIFNGIDIFGELFSRKDFVKKLLFPTYYCRLSYKQFYALRKTLEVLKLHREVYEFITEDENKLITHNLGKETYEQYCENTNSALDNHLFSENDSWGIGISHEEFAILGCTEEFYNVFQSYYHKDDKSEFVKYWEAEILESKCNLDWIEDFIKTKL